MGGYGSGRHGWKGTTAGYRQIDVRWMQRKGYLRPGMQSSLRWSRNGEPTGSINYRVEQDHIVLSYRHRRHDLEEWQSVEYPVFLVRTPCNYGCERAWFRCPSRGCGRRVAVLWGGEIFACRQCHNLAYESQNETAHSRALSKTQAIRVRLGGEPGLIHDFPAKPKGMHWQTYWRLKAQADEAENRSWPPWVFKW
jgi:hypothetical protein